MLRMVLFCLFLSTCATEPSFAKVLPGVWDGTCEAIGDPYHHHNPEVDSKGQGYIPEDKQPDNTDISACLPPANTEMGPK